MKTNKTITLPVAATYKPDGTVEYEYRELSIDEVVKAWGLMPTGGSA
ncbi:MAG: hypothetical protein RSD88_06905 [Anaerovoracaceae bacterium]